MGVPETHEESSSRSGEKIHERAGLCILYFRCVYSLQWYYTSS